MKKELIYNIFDFQCKNCKYFKPKLKSNCNIYTSLIKKIIDGEKLNQWQEGVCSLVFGISGCKNYDERIKNVKR